MPVLRKKIIYLDQNFISNAFKDKNPLFSNVKNKILDLSAKQLIICPYSEIHEMEVHLWKLKLEDKKKLWNLIRKIFQGNKFYDRTDIKAKQFRRAVAAFISQQRMKYRMDVEEAVDIAMYEVGTEALAIEPCFVDTPTLQLNKQNATNFLVNKISEWQKHPNLSFEEDYLVETDEIRKQLCNWCTQGTIGSIISNNGHLPEITSIFSTLMPLVGTSEKNNDNSILKFFNSENFSSIPFVRMQGYLYAMLKQKIRSGWLKKQSNAIEHLSGIWFDIEFISVYAPYCEAIFTDRAMYNLLKESSLKQPDLFSFKIFSVANLKEFDDYLNSLKQLM